MATKKNRTRRNFGSLRKLPSGRYQAHYPGPDGVRYKAPDTFATKTDAEGWLASERRHIDLGDWQPPEQRQQAAQEDHARRALTVGKWLETYHDSLEVGAEALQASTVQTHRRSFRNRITKPIGAGVDVDAITRLADIPLVDLTKQDCARWWYAVKDTYPDTASANRKAYQRLRKASEEAVKRGLIPANPVLVEDAAKGVKTKDKRLPTNEELAAIIDGMPDRYKAIASLCFHHGLRIGEALALETRHVVVAADPERPDQVQVSVVVEQNMQRMGGDKATKAKGYMYLHEAAKTKAGRRVVPIVAKDVPIILGQLERARREDVETLVTVKRAGKADVQRPLRLLTTTSRGGVLWDTAFRVELKRVMGDLGLDVKITPHYGRNWLITALAERGATPQEIGHVLGQKDLKTITETYMKVRPGRTRAMMDGINAALEG